MKLLVVRATSATGLKLQSGLTVERQWSGACYRRCVRTRAIAYRKQSQATHEHEQFVIKHSRFELKTETEQVLDRQTVQCPTYRASSAPIPYV
ncbi:hypothetical protein SFRURICE_013273 [Spodoptera frugiperda]|nr:hypothetical protein SFRURICE_013273 [Spodoptera frugiperda]